MGVELLIENSRELNNLKGVFLNNVLKKSSALSLTLKGKKADSERINEGIKLIKNNTSVFSRLRGNNLIITATTIALEDNMEQALEEINKIYENLKNEFMTTEYLGLAAIIIFNSVKKYEGKEVVKKARVAYDEMKRHHKFLTSSEDVVAAVMIGIATDNIGEAIERVEKYYMGLNDKGYWKGNSLQSLSHILGLSTGDIENNIEKVELLDKTLRDNNIKINGYSLPILGLASLITEDFKGFSKKVKNTSDILKREKGFGGFTLGTDVRNMIALGLEINSSIEGISEEEKKNITDTTNSILLVIQIAIEIAMACGAAAAAAGSAGN